MKRFALIAILALAACRLGPEYERPDYPVPDEHRGGQAAPSDARTVADIQWFELFDDPVLTGLMETALRENYDVRIAAERVLEARSRVTISRADLYPEVNLSGFTDVTKITRNGPGPRPEGVDRNQESSGVSLDLGWEIDFWGRIRSATDAARADLLATEFARAAVVQTLLTDLALAYFELLELDEELRITRRTLESRVVSETLVTYRLEQGVANKVELRQAQSLVVFTEGLIPELELAIEQQENLIRLLVGGNPGPVTRGKSLLEADRSIEVPAGLPSSLLERRPDILVAEQRLIAANARIGEAKALLYPTIRLTANYGAVSEHLSDLSDKDSATGNLTSSLLMPIFNAGRLDANVEVTESQQRQAALEYRRTVQNAFREVADALVAHQRRREVTEYVQEYERILGDQASLSTERYRGGVTSYLEVLDSQRDHFDSQLELARRIRDELFTTVLLYSALGGGWPTAVEVADGPAPAEKKDAATSGGW